MLRKDPSEFSVDLWIHYRGTWVVSDFLQGLGVDPHILRKAGSGESVQENLTLPYRQQIFD